MLILKAFIQSRFSRSTCVRCCLTCGAISCGAWSKNNTWFGFRFLVYWWRQFCISFVLFSINVFLVGAFRFVSFRFFFRFVSIFFGGERFVSYSGNMSFLCFYYRYACSRMRYRGSIFCLMRQYFSPTMLLKGTEEVTNNARHIAVTPLLRVWYNQKAYAMGLSTSSCTFLVAQGRFFWVTAGIEVNNSSREKPRKT